MKHVINAMSILFILSMTFSSCSKVDWKLLKDKRGVNFLVPDCDVQRMYTLATNGSMIVQMQKTYNTVGRVKKISFYSQSGTSEDMFWHSFLLDYNVFNRTVIITDSATGSFFLKAFFTNKDRLERIERPGRDRSGLSALTFIYAAGRLAAIRSLTQNSEPVESFTYDSNGNLVSRQAGMSLAAIYTYGAAAINKRQFYIPQYNYMILIDPTMALLEYLGWMDFSPKNIRIGIQYFAPLPGEESFSAHVFDADGKLTSYNLGGQFGDPVGSTKYIDWSCTAHSK
jgi:hypothetical protein